MKKFTFLASDNKSEWSTLAANREAASHKLSEALPNSHTYTYIPAGISSLEPLQVVRTPGLEFTFKSNDGFSEYSIIAANPEAAAHKLSERIYNHNEYSYVPSGSKELLNEELNEEVWNEDNYASEPSLGLFLQSKPH